MVSKLKPSIFLKKFMKRGKTMCHNYPTKDIDKKFNKNSFDAILIIHTFHHMMDVSNILSKAGQVLKLGGKIYLEEYERNYGEKLDNCPWFSSGKIKSMLKKAGFKSIQKHNFHKDFVMISAMK